MVIATTQAGFCPLCFLLQWGGFNMRRSPVLISLENKLRILQSRAVGGSIDSIAADLQLPASEVHDTLDLLNTEARENLKKYITSAVPLQWQISIEINRLVIKKSIEIANSPKADGRLVAQVLDIAMRANDSINRFMSDAMKIDQAVSRAEAKGIGLTAETDETADLMEGQTEV